ncbi:MAG: phosphopantetheine-binding protein, partial [Verrucomicrobiota bacterium]
LRGYRIELEEIEAVLARHPLLRQATLLLHLNSQNEKSLVAYVIVNPGSVLEISDLRTHLQQKLPRYMIPAHFVFLTEFPLTHNGKVDRSKLPAPEDSVPLSTAAVLPRSDTEEKLFAIWQDVLGQRNFGVRENFFELGGHSLLATQVASRINQNLKVELSLRKIFEFPTIELLALEIAKSPRSTGVDRPILSRRAKRSGSVPPDGIEPSPAKKGDALATEV